MLFSSSQLLTMNQIKKSIQNPKKPILLYGSTGTGKTEIIKSIAKELNHDLIEINASDTRSEKRIEELLGQTIQQTSLFKKGKIILIDELEGLTGKDRNASKGITNIIKKSKFPVILIVKNPYTEKMVNLRKISILIQMKTPTIWDVEKIIKDFSIKNNLNPSPDTTRKIAKSSRGDIRAAIIDVQNFENHPEDLYERKKEENIFTVLNKIFKSDNPKEIKNYILNCDKSPEEILKWIEENITTEFTDKKELIEALNLLSKVDLNKRNKSFLNLITCFSKIKKNKSNYTKYKPYRRIYKRKTDNKDLANKLHISQKKLNKELPYMNIFLK